MTRITLKMVLMLGLLAVLIVSVAGCTTTTNNTPTQHDGTLQKSVLTIQTTNTAPAVGEQYTVHGVLQDGLTGAPIPYQPFRFVIHYGPNGATIYPINATTDANGAYSFTRSESAQGTYWLEVDFYGTSNYLKSSAMIFLTVGNPTPTSISVGVTNSNPAVGHSFTFTGSLTDINGTKLSNRTVWIGIRLPNGDWDMTPYTTTDSNGYFSKTFSEQSAGLYRFEFHFYGDSTYAHSATAVEVAVGTLTATTLTMNASVAHPGTGESFTLSGYLKDANGAPLSGEEILLGRTVVGQPTNPSDGGAYESSFTDQNGYYSFVLNESASGSYYYSANFMGDQTHANSSVLISITVGTLT